jgi:amino acid transporter
MTREPQLARGIGRADLVAILVNTVVGAGVLGLPAKTFALVGAQSAVAWIVCAAIMGVVALCFAEVGSRFRASGGPYLYARAAFGPAVGFGVGWLNWVSRLFSYAAISNLAVNYAGGLSPPGEMSGALRLIVITAATLVLTALLVVGIRRSAWVNNVLTLCKLSLLVGFVALVLPHADAERLMAFGQHSLADWRSAILLMVFAFVGVESGLINSGEMRDPRCDIPFALAAGLSGIALLYLLIQIACMGVLPDLATSTRPVAEAAERVYGPVAGIVVSVGGIVTMCGTLFAVLLTGSRLPLALAEQGQAPRWLAAVHPAFKTPVAAILLTGACSWGVTVSSSFFGALAVTATTRLVGYATTCAALVVLRRRSPATIDEGYRAPGGGAAALAGSAASVVLIASASPAELGTVAVLTLAGALLGGAYALWRRLAP